MIFTDFQFLELKICISKYQCPSLSRYLLLLGMNVFGFKAKGIARSQIDDSTCLNSNPENFPKYLYSNFQIWFPDSKFKPPKYIKNVHSLGTPVLRFFEFFLPILRDYRDVNLTVKGNFASF